MIYIQGRIHATTGLFAAFSDELQGLLVVGATWQEIETKLPGAICGLMDAMGTPVERVELSGVLESSPEWVIKPKFKAELRCVA